MMKHYKSIIHFNNSLLYYSEFKESLSKQSFIALLILFYLLIENLFEDFW